MAVSLIPMSQMQAYNQAQNLGPTPYSSQEAEDEKNVLMRYLAQSQPPADMSQDLMPYAQDNQSPFQMPDYMNPPLPEQELSPMPITPENQATAQMLPQMQAQSSQSIYQPLLDLQARGIQEQRDNLETLKN